MELSNEFIVAAPIERAWAVLTDVETIAPCLPGAHLQEIDGEEYRGVVKVKVGPITAQYKGKAVFIEKDPAARRVVLRGDGRDTRGQGNASALITAELEPVDADSTRVTVSTDLTVTGKVAQFGRGVMADISGKLMDQFAANLSATVLGVAAPDAAATPSPSVTPPPPAPSAAGPAPVTTNGSPSPSKPPLASGVTPPPAVNTTGSAGVAGSGSTAGPPTLRRLDLPDPDPVDLIEAAGGAMMKRVVPALGFLGLVLVLIRLFGGRRSR